MSNDAIEPGCVLHWVGFKFKDGNTANKYFVIVGAQPNKNYLAVITTSRQKRGRKPQAGGNHEGGWYHIPGGGKDFFPDDTWLLFEEPVELCTHPASTPGRRDGVPRSAQAATAALDCWFAFQFQGSRSATLLAG